MLIVVFTLVWLESCSFTLVADAVFHGCFLCEGESLHCLAWFLSGLSCVHQLVRNRNLRSLLRGHTALLQEGEALLSDSGSSLLSLSLFLGSGNDRRRSHAKEELEVFVENRRK